MLRGRSLRHRVEIEAAGPPAALAVFAARLATDPAAVRPRTHHAVFDPQRRTDAGPEGGATHDLTAENPQILLCTAGTVHAGDLALAPGESAFVPAGEKAEVSGTGTVFRATVVA